MYIGLYRITHMLEEYIRIDRGIERVRVGHGLMGAGIEERKTFIFLRNVKAWHVEKF